ncbi:hypothetical protein MPH_12383 [Macrophomina phaseolina MS6]|uniref:Uncharacterized protein n=1 Tax=Macrophomina phaseolina (strain MS6) TaxID=1126212 RepID=K2S1E5_MACPH|nr:hypothetical protein MPH_12383 [Macrophomina phaseolina MS6]
MGRTMSSDGVSCISGPRLSNKSIGLALCGPKHCHPSFFLTFVNQTQKGGEKKRNEKQSDSNLFCPVQNSQTTLLLSTTHLPTPYSLAFATSSWNTFLALTSSCSRSSPQIQSILVRKLSRTLSTSSP